MFEKLFNICFNPNYRNDTILSKYLNLIYNNPNTFKPNSQIEERSASSKGFKKHHIIPIPFFKFFNPRLYNNQQYDKIKENVIYLTYVDYLEANRLLYHYFKTTDKSQYESSIYILNTFKRLLKNIPNKSIITKFINGSKYTEDDYNTFINIMKDRYSLKGKKQ